MVYGRGESDSPLSKLASTLEGRFLENIVLREVALLATNQSQQESKDMDMNILDNNTNNSNDGEFLNL